MVKGIGTDIIEVGRIKNQIEKNNGLIESLFTKNEIEYCETFKHKQENYAARFAAKEAFFKAIGTGYRFGMAFTEIEISNDELGKPSLIAFGKTKEHIKKLGIQHIHVSLSHTKEYATATVIIEN